MLQDNPMKMESTGQLIRRANEAVAEQSNLAAERHRLKLKFAKYCTDTTQPQTERSAAFPRQKWSGTTIAWEMTESPFIAIAR